jgi:hypothetical protein
MVDEGSLRQQVRERAGHHCEYCQLPDDLVSTPFQIDHIIAEKHAGENTLDNLAWSCLHCNSFKGPNIAGRDRQTRQTVPLFSPRRDDWHAHFAWDGPVMRGLTSVARATIAVLRINLPYRVSVRATLIEEGVFPPAP